MKFLIIVLVILLFLYYSEFNTRKVNYENINYNVHNSNELKDREDSAKIMSELNRRTKILEEHLKKKYLAPKIGAIDDASDMRSRTEQLIINYDPNNIYEISPNNIMGNTSFTQNKTKLVLCLRDKNTGKLHDTNTLMFVKLHELTHMMNEEWGHELQFWQLFQVVLQDAVECGIYVPVNYAKKPQKYCGIDIVQSPLFQ